ncbi:hydroxyethylthiazole kinase [Pontibacter qinzhouensis]|uniref:Hydroxyethylthiazole kinase n=1 Tax=Pontibacter qinzhouensis TaxID=2603253 RepID=A0A5C8K8F0_9BACT|nr:hydroxyethylthiazole kinase [Pontibacter qinzhouensis]TXK48052.1 hydroxyethylthiazole kinase [Pontibacter qinzhouensis]
MKDILWQTIQAVKATSPLVHNITNYVVMNNTANALLAAGASPVMAHAHSEIEAMTGIASALVINIGTLDEYWVESMRRAVLEAEKLQKPWVLDPVGAGATPYRDRVLEELLKHKPTVVRGNASEILALASKGTGTKGVDSINESTEALDAAIVLSKNTGAVICVSGAEDLLVQQAQGLSITNGHPLMAKITGMGCTATALIGACCAVLPAQPLLATAAAMALMGIAGEMAAEKSAGPGSLQLHFLDMLHTLSENDFMQRLKLKQLDAAF